MSGAVQPIRGILAGMARFLIHQRLVRHGTTDHEVRLLACPLAPVSEEIDDIEVVERVHLTIAAARQAAAAARDALIQRLAGAGHEVVEFGGSD